MTPRLRIVATDTSWLPVIHFASPEFCEDVDLSQSLRSANSCAMMCSRVFGTPLWSVLNGLMVCQNSFVCWRRLPFSIHTRLALIETFWNVTLMTVNPLQIVILRLGFRRGRRTPDNASHLLHRYRNRLPP